MSERASQATDEPVPFHAHHPFLLCSGRRSGKVMFPLAAPGSRSWVWPGPVLLAARSDGPDAETTWFRQPLINSSQGMGRGIGPCDMVDAILPIRSALRRGDRASM